jgi:hypothetical protein
MRAAIYARKSTDDSDVAKEARSTERQIEGARAFIVQQGWTLAPAHIYKDEATSGALFASREWFQKMMTDAASGAWDALVFYDLDRFGRNARLTMEALNTLADHGITVPERTHGKYLLTGGMLVCPTCKGHFEAIKYPFPAYVCATRRRKPKSCPNYLTLPMAEADAAVLDLVEEHALGSRFIEELIGMVDKGHVEDRSRLASDRERLRAEIKNLLHLAASGVPPETIAPEIRSREIEISRLDVRLRAPLPEAPRVDELRVALEQRAADWRETLRKEPAVARMLVRRLISPLDLYDASAPEWQMPDFIRGDTEIQPGLLEGLVPHEAYNRLASPAVDAGDVYTEVASPTGFEPVFWP